VLHVVLHNRVVVAPADKPLRVVDRVVDVHRNLVLGGVADQSLAVREGDVARRRSVALVVRDDFDAVVLPDPHAAEGGAKVDSY